MAKISPTAAANKWKASKTTIYKLMNDGELSYTLNDKGKRVLDTSELVRVLGEPERSEKQSVAAMQEQLQRQNDEMMRIMKSQIESQQKQIEELTQAVSRFSMAIEHKQAEPTKSISRSEVEPKPKTSLPAKRKKSLLQRVLSAMVED